MCSHHQCIANTTTVVVSTLLHAGLITLLLATVISLYTILQLAWMHEEVDEKTGKVVRLNRYHQLTQYAFGEHLCFQHPSLCCQPLACS